MLTARFADAFAYASIVHAGQQKKGGKVPYIAHLMEVASIVLAHDGNEDEAIGALLHDAAEDAGGRPRLEDIRARFGDAVAVIVEGCSDTFDDPKPPWLARKAAYIAHVPDVSESTRLVSAADKLANVRSILTDYTRVGEAVWQRFSGGREGTLWYYRTLADLFLRLGPERLAILLDETVRELQRRVGMEGEIPKPDRV